MEASDAYDSPTSVVAAHEMGIPANMGVTVALASQEQSLAHAEQVMAQLSNGGEEIANGNANDVRTESATRDLGRVGDRRRSNMVVQGDFFRRPWLFAGGCIGLVVIFGRCDVLIFLIGFLTCALAEALKKSPLFKLAMY
eukprot:TRINITY_DN49477_c0_g1_i1.p1 TRINITY_DN49477_c0_g1~~TRINITY_DN49477_c0_g1_i1.p1  ORF type:complete len:140 (+),score=24.23 TRINITY_DN49477_c0_g1_i1:51-470(+)